MAGDGSGPALSPPSPRWPERLFGWTPFRAAFHGPEMLVDWCHLHGRRATEPFFHATVAEAMRHPFNLAFQQRTPIEALAELPPGLPVAGFVFHMSRCGSTLITQALAAFESNIVVSEAAPLRSVLRAHGVGRASPDAVSGWLKGLVNAYAQQRFSYEARLVVKFMAADVLDIALVRNAFPDVPWIFVTRDPAEILASQAASAGVDLLPGQVAASRLGLTGAVETMEETAYRAHVLAALAQAALDAHASGRGIILDHSELPSALWTKVAAHFGLHPHPAALDLMQAVSRRHSKRPAEPFVLDRDPNRAAAAPFRAIANTIIGPRMAALAALRAA